MLKMLVTRPEPDASETAARLKALAIEPVLAPLLVFGLLDTSLPDPAGFSAMAVTSGNALRALNERGKIEPYRSLKVFCVGDKTAEAARTLGFSDVVSASGNLSDLVELIAGAGLAGPVFYPAAHDQAGNLGKALAARGIMVITAKVYAMAPAKNLMAPVQAGLQSGAIGAALFFSHRTAQTFVSLVKSDMPEPVRARLGVLCVSETVAQPLIDAHFVRVSLADYPSEEAMLALALSFARDQNPA